MADDLAILGLGVESTELTKGVQEMRGLQAEATKTEKSATRLNAQLAGIERELKQLNATMRQSVAVPLPEQMQQVVASATRMGASVGTTAVSVARLTAIEVENAAASARMVMGMNSSALASQRLVAGMSAAGQQAAALAAASQANAAALDRQSVATQRATVAAQANAAASARMIAGMNSSTLASQRLIAGMSAAGAAAAQTAGQLDLVKTSASGVLASFKGLVALSSAWMAFGVLKDYSQEMSNLRSVLDGTEEQLSKLDAAAKRIGADTSFAASASEAASAMVELAKAGYDADAVLTAIDGTLSLAQAGQLDFAAAAETAVGVMSGFRLGAEEIGRVGDVLVYTANATTSGVRDLGEAFSYVGPIASGLGVDFEQTAAALGVLSDAGLRGSSAGTGLRQVLSSLAAPSKQAETIMRALGLSAVDTSVKQLGLVKVLQNLRDAGVDTSVALQLFGDRGGPAFEVLAQGVPRIQELTTQLGEAGGTAVTVAQVMNDNLGGSWKGLISTLGTFIIVLGDAGLLTALRGVIDGTSLLIGVLTDFAPLILAIAAYIGTNLVVNALTPLYNNLVKAIPILWGNTAAWTALNTAIRANPIGAVISAGVLLVSVFFSLRDESTALGKAWAWLVEQVMRIAEWLGILEEGSVEAAAANKKAAEEADKASNAYEDQGKKMGLTQDQLASLIAEYEKGQKVSASFGNETENTARKLDQKAGATRRAKEELRSFNDVLEDSYRRLGTTRAEIDRTLESLGAMHRASVEASAAADMLSSSYQKLGTAASTAATAISSAANAASRGINISGAGGGFFDVGTGGGGHFSGAGATASKEAALQLANQLGLGGVGGLIQQLEEQSPTHFTYDPFGGGATFTSFKPLFDNVQKALQMATDAGKLVTPEAARRLPSGLATSSTDKDVEAYLNWWVDRLPKAPNLDNVAALNRGGSFTVPGSGSGDKVIPIFRATPGEEVTVSPKGRKGGGDVVIESIQVVLPGITRPDQIRQTQTQASAMMGKAIGRALRVAG